MFVFFNWRSAIRCEERKNLNAGAEISLFCFFFEDRDLVRKGCLDHELISCSRASEKHRKKEQVFFVRIIEILQCLYRSLSKWCAYACSISVRDVCAMLNGVVSKAFREYGTQNHSSEYFLLFFYLPLFFSLSFSLPSYILFIDKDAIAHPQAKLFGLNAVSSSSFSTLPLMPKIASMFNI